MSFEPSQNDIADFRAAENLQEREQIDNPSECCPVCNKQFGDRAAMRTHLTNKPGHLEWIGIELRSLREENATLKDSVKAWRELANSRKDK